MMMRLFCEWVLVTAIALVGIVESNNNDLFNFDWPYRETADGSTDWGQPDWNKVSCDDLEYCSGYSDKFLNSIGFSVAGSNNCEYCPEASSIDCGQHRQSPINLLRNRGVVGDPMEKECIDWHFIRYQTGSCDWSDYATQFRIERQALRIYVPEESNGEVACENNGFRRYPRMDYSKGYPAWWWLDHIDVLTPSNHIQEGKQYDAEVILKHFYSVADDTNQLGYISIFLQSYDDAESWPYLDKLICQWRLEEERVRSACGLDPAPAYGMCRLFRNQVQRERGLDEEAGGGNTAQTQASEEPVIGPTANRNLRANGSTRKVEASNSSMSVAFDESNIPEGAKVIYAGGRRFVLRKENVEQSEESEEEWFNRVYTDFKHREAQTTVHDVDYDDVFFWEYEWLVKVGTEYYFRYEGTQLVPPCLETVHWRVFKDPIRVQWSQIAELNRLLAWRVSEAGANYCQVDTAGILRGTDMVEMNRDVQYYHDLHRMTFCECKDWPSKFESDRAWCSDWRDDPGTQRFYSTPYNFDTGGVF